MLYDYISENLVQDVIVYNTTDIVRDMYEVYRGLHRHEWIELFAPKDIVLDIWDYLVAYVDDIFIDEESPDPEEMEEDELLLSLAYDGVIFVECARGTNNNLKRGDSALIYIYDGFQRSDVERLEAEGNSILVFGFKDDSIYSGYHVERTIDNGCLHGCTVEKIDDGATYSKAVFYTSDDMSDGELDDVIRTIERFV